MLNRLKNARFETTSMKTVRIRSLWVHLGRYFTRIDPIVSRMPLGYLLDSKIPQKNKKTVDPSVERF